MAHGDAREGKWRGNWRMEWVASTLHTTSEHGVSSINTADAHNSAASSGLNWRPHRFKWTRPFRRKMKSGFCACTITFQLASTSREVVSLLPLLAQPVFVKWAQRLVFLRCRGRGERLTTHHHLTPRLRTSVTVPPLHLHVVDREEL